MGRCPVCGCPGALIGLRLVACLSAACRCYHAPEYQAFLDALNRDAVEHNGASMDEITRWLWDAEGYAY